MHWAMVGWSHHQTPVEIRERLAFSPAQVVEALKRFRSQFPEAESVLLSTCNRVELYCAADKTELMPDTDRLGMFLADFHNYPYANVQQQLTALQGEESLRHLFMVAASLDSMVVGEAQILAQVKDAYQVACDADLASRLMHQAFQRATVVARRVANETEVHKRRISIPSVAVSEIATEFFERFDDKRILLIGAGEMGTETLQYLVGEGAKNITVVNRSPQRAEELANQFDAQVLDWDQRYEQAVVSDLIVSTTGAQEPVIEAQQFKDVRARHGSRASLILDLAVPRDFDSEIDDIADVYLFSLDDLQQVCERNKEARKQQWPQACEIVEQETQRFLSDIRHRGSGSTIKQLREQADRVKQDELQRLISKLQERGADESLQKDVEIAFDRLVNKLLHPPLKSLRENADSSHHATLLESLRRLFQLKE